MTHFRLLMPGERYYLDAMVLIHFDNNDLLGALREFAENTHARLLTTQTVLGETVSPKHKMSDLFSDMLSNGIIEIVDEVPPTADRTVAEIETLTADLGPGESSLIKMVARDEAPGKPVLVLNDGKAFERSGGVGIDVMLEADYLALLVGDEAGRAVTPWSLLKTYWPRICQGAGAALGGQHDPAVAAKATRSFTWPRMAAGHATARSACATSRAPLGPTL